MTFLSIPTWPPAGGLSTVLVPRAATTFSVFASVTFHAPACIIFDNLRNTSSYPEWNTFTPSATIDFPHNPVHPDFLTTGDTFTFVVILDPAVPQNTTQSPEKVFDISTPKSPSSYVSPALLKDGSFYPDLTKVYRASWGDNNPATQGGLLVTERFSEVIEVGKKKSVYHTWENFGGPMSASLQQIQATLQARFEDYASDLKAYSERLFHERKQRPPVKGGQADSRCCYA